MSGWILKGLGGMFWHAFRCASHFITQCFYECSNHAFAFTCDLPIFPCHILQRPILERLFILHVFFFNIRTPSP